MKIEKRFINHEGWKKNHQPEDWKQGSSTVKVGKRLSILKKQNQQPQKSTTQTGL